MAVFISLLSLACLVVAVSACLNSIRRVRVLDSAPQHISPLEDTVEDLALLAARESFSGWFARNGFVAQNSLRMDSTDPQDPLGLGVWWSDSLQTWGLVQVSQDHNLLTFISPYSESMSLTTTTDKQAPALPRPVEALLQTFVGFSPDALFRWHLQTLRSIETRLGMVPACPDPTLMDFLIRASRQQARYVRQQRAWKIRGPWWYYVRRPLSLNKPLDI
jgi:hypothetical protein